MNENKVTTYGDLKYRKAELRDKMDFVDLVNIKEYRQVLQAIKDVELFLLYSITPDESCGKLPEQVKPKVYKRVKYVFVGISIAVILSIVLFGCSVARESLHLVGAVGEDVGWIANKAAENIRTEK